MGGRGGAPMRAQSNTTAAPAAAATAPTAPAPTAPAPSPPAGQSISDRLRNATTRDQARSALQGLSSKQLHAVANDVGMPRGGARPPNKVELAQAIVEFTVGNRINSTAIRGL